MGDKEDEISTTVVVTALSDRFTMSFFILITVHSSKVWTKKIGVLFDFKAKAVFER
jgi:hypothetical protein